MQHPPSPPLQLTDLSLAMSVLLQDAHNPVETQTSSTLPTSPAQHKIDDILDTHPGNHSCRCSQKDSPAGGRNLVVCIDGTANQFGAIVSRHVSSSLTSLNHRHIFQTTNVIKLYSRLHKDKEQLTYYNSGIGTYVTEKKSHVGRGKQAVANFMDIAIAWCVSSNSPNRLVLVLTPHLYYYRHFSRIVLGAYQWLCENHKPGDHIFLFGELHGLQ